MTYLHTNEVMTYLHTNEVPVCRSHRNPDVGHVTGSDLLLTEEREEGVMMVMVVVIGG